MTTAAEIALAATRIARGVSVTYRRGATEIALTAIPAGVESGEDASAYNTVAYQARGWIYEAADVSDLDPVVPQRGDEIDETVDGITRTYLVTAPTGQKIFRWMGTEYTWLKAHTKLTNEEAAS